MVCVGVSAVCVSVSRCVCFVFLVMKRTDTLTSETGPFHHGLLSLSVRVCGFVCVCVCETVSVCV